MATHDRATAEAPVRHRPNWSVRTIVENLSGHPIAHFQDPPQSLPNPPTTRPLVGPSESPARSNALPEDGPLGEPRDPTEAIYPPLVGALGREYHGKDREHHAETMAHHRGDATGVPGSRGPLARPERIYLHYLLLHMDRLSDTALVYLGHAVEEERVHRASARSTGPGP